MVRRVAPSRSPSVTPASNHGSGCSVILTANHDPAVFDHPATVDLGRDPNPHLGFGWGLHHCLGAPLARMELMMALRALYRAMPDLRAVPA